MDQDLPAEDVPQDEPVVVPAPETPKPFLSNTLYARLKWATLILLPALSAAYFALAGTLGLPAAEQVVGTIAVLCTFLGTVLGLSSRQYNNSGAAFDGSVNLEPDYENDVTNVGVSIDPAALESGQKELRLRVKHA